MAKTNKAADLLKVLGQKSPSAPPPTTPPPPPRRQPADPPRKERLAARHTVPKGGRGKAIQFYLHESDEKLIREFAVWLAPHRKRINDSLIIKSVLRAAKTGPGFLVAYDEGLAVTKAHRDQNRRMEDR